MENFLSEVTIRNYQHPDDYPAVYQVWKDTGQGIRLTQSDEQSEIEKLALKSPGLFFIAEYKSKIIGTVMGGFDGRRGLIYHLAVLPEYQNHQIGSRLLEVVEEKLRTDGCIKVYLFILPGNNELSNFYYKKGYQKMDVIPFTKIFKDSILY